MSIFPRKYHGPELKCSGIPFCRDCVEKNKGSEKYKNLDILDIQISNSSQKETKKDCECLPRVLFWKGCQCGAYQKKV